MALDFNNSRLLLWLRANGLDFGEVLTIGRLGVFLSPQVLERDADRFRVAPVGRSWREAVNARYADDLITAMGAASVKSLDFSDYEGASILHDLNTRLPNSLHTVCDLLFDSGSLEHVFNVPQALENYVHLVRPGGYLILDLPTDGCCGHGFFQFAPELFFRYFVPENGCRIEAVFCVRNEPFSEWYLVPDPDKIKRRVELKSLNPLHLFIVAKRLETTASLPTLTPAQADYKAAWSGNSHTDIPPPQRTEANLGSKLRRAANRLAPMTYWKLSVVRNERRKRRHFLLGRSPLLERIDPFTWRLSSK